MIDPGLALGQIAGSFEVHPRSELRKPQLPETVDQISHDQMDFEMGAGFDLQAFIMKAAGQSGLVPMDFRIAIEGSTLRIEPFQLMDFNDHVPPSREVVSADSQKGRNYTQIRGPVQGAGADAVPRLVVGDSDTLPWAVGFPHPLRILPEALIGCLPEDIESLLIFVPKK